MYTFDRDIVQGPGCPRLFNLYRLFRTEYISKQSIIFNNRFSTRRLAHFMIWAQSDMDWLCYIPYIKGLRNIELWLGRDTVNRSISRPPYPPSRLPSCSGIKRLGWKHGSIRKPSKAKNILFRGKTFFLFFCLKLFSIYVKASLGK